MCKFVCKEKSGFKTGSEGGHLIIMEDLSLGKSIKATVRSSAYSFLFNSWMELPPYHSPV